MRFSDDPARSIVFVGLPGAGKSTIGRNLSKVLKRDFIDTDHAIEQRVGCSIPTFFERESEERFRAIESEVLTAALCGPAAVIATGGGIVKREHNRTLITEHGIAIYLRASPRDLAVRLRHDTRRPLLQGVDRLRKLEELYEERHGFYDATARFTVDSMGRPLHAVLQEVVQLLDLNHAKASSAAPHESDQLPGHGTKS